jgi:hypothetical protein
LKLQAIFTLPSPHVEKYKKMQYDRGMANPKGWLASSSFFAYHHLGKSRPGASLLAQPSDAERTGFWPNSYQKRLPRLGNPADGPQERSISAQWIR